MRDRQERGRHRGRHHDNHNWRRMRHGDIRAALLLALQEGPTHGYELGQRLERASQGAWKPSPGSIYPTLQALADEDLLVVTERDGKKIYELSKTAIAELKERASRGEATPWAAATLAPNGELKEAVHSLKDAARQLGSVGTAAQVARATEIVVEARRQMYELLAKG